MLSTPFKTLFAIIFCTVVANGQSQNDDKIFTNYLKDYFELDRENIHLHLNKDVYITNEKIWLKGYIIEKKNAKPYVPTSNVYINLLDADGKNILTNLYYAENSLFSGYVTLDARLKSGKYTLQVYTNYMNNFYEDESTLIPIFIINENDSTYVDYKKINYNSITTSLFPESGVFLEGITNTIGIKITDCNGNGISVSNGQLFAPNGQSISTYSTNQYGYGKFEIKNTENGIYKVTFEIEGKNFEKNLPQPQITGIAFSANNYAYPEKTVLTVRTNKRTLENLIGQKHTIVIHQNDNVSSADVTFNQNETEKLLSISNQFLSDGINTIRLLNSENRQLAERTIFKPFAIKSETAVALQAKRTDSLVFIGKSALSFASLSISVLPAKTTASTKSSIYGSLHLNNFINSNVEDPQYFLNNFNRKKHFELDNVLLTAASKYQWQSILKSPPTKKFDFDSGLSIKGTVNSAVPNSDKVSIVMSSYFLRINERTKLNSKKEFQFDNVMAVDSSIIFFSLLDEKERFAKLSMFTRLINPKRPFLKPSIPKSTICDVGNAVTAIINLPEVRNAVELNTVMVEGVNKKETLNEKYKFRYNNNMSRGYKITETEAGTFRDVLQWIGSHGFNVSTEAGKVIITRGYSLSFQGSNSPSIYIDDAPLSDVDLLLNMSMDSVDEIYINRSGYGSGSTGGSGIIRIYTKIPSGGLQNLVKINSQSLLIQNGFQSFKPYKNPNYSSVNDASFHQFGTIAWLDNVDSDENGVFKFSIPNLYQDSVLLLLEGISADGQVISERITVEIANE